MKFQSALVAVALADIEPLKRLDTLVRSRSYENSSKKRKHLIVLRTIDFGYNSLFINTGPKLCKKSHHIHV